jgi:hypothetical protein
MKNVVSPRTAVLSSAEKYRVEDGILIWQMHIFRLLIKWGSAVDVLIGAVVGLARYTKAC